MMTDPGWEQLEEERFIEFVNSEGWAEFENLLLEDPGDEVDEP